MTNETIQCRTQSPPLRLNANTNSNHSTLRDVPSNQEVYLQTDGLTSIVIEILEYACPPEHPCKTDEEALKYHYADMVAGGHVREGTEDEETTRFWAVGFDVHMPRLEGTQDVRVLSTVGTQTPIRIGSSTGGGDAGKIDFTALLVTLIRLPALQADMLITVNVPHAKGEYDAASLDLEKGMWGSLIERGLEIRKELWESFEVKDWGLFQG